MPTSRRTRRGNWRRIARTTAQLEEVCTVSLNVFRLLTLYLKPVLPEVARAVEEFLNIAPLAVERRGHAAARSQDQPLQAPHGASGPEADGCAVRHTAGRSERGCDRRGRQCKGDAPLSRPQAPVQAARCHPRNRHHRTARPLRSRSTTSRRVDLRVARIVNAEHVEGSDKLLKLTLDLGTETRTVFSGIKSAYDPEKLKAASRWWWRTSRLAK